MKVLTVDDDPDMTALLLASLSAAGFEVRVAHDGDQGWRVAEEEGVRIALVDWEMPGMNGVELCRKLRARRGRPYTYVIMITARATREDYLSAMAAGADDFLSKPVDTDMLLARLRVAQRVLALQQALDGLGAMLCLCMYCQSVRTTEDAWKRLDHYIAETTETLISHGMCPTCYEKHRYRGV